MKKHVGVAGYGGIAAEELAKWTAEDIDQRLGKLPRRCYPLVLSGSLCLNPFNQGNYPNDGLVMVEETTLPGEFRHEVRSYSASWRSAMLVLTISLCMPLSGRGCDTLHDACASSNCPPHPVISRGLSSNDEENEAKHNQFV